jgi:hypothetical protein
MEAALAFEHARSIRLAWARDASDNDREARSMLVVFVYALVVICQGWLYLSVIWLGVRLFAFLRTGPGSTLFELVVQAGLAAVLPIIASLVATAALGASAVFGADSVFWVVHLMIGQSLLVLWSLQRLPKPRNRHVMLIVSTSIGLLFGIGSLLSHHRVNPGDRLDSAGFVFWLGAACLQFGWFFGHAYVHRSNGKPWLSPLPKN